MIMKASVNEPSLIMAKKKSTRRITSYGVIVFQVIDATPYFLLQLQRDSYAYINFFKGDWSTLDEAFIMILRMSQEERQRITKFEYKFDELWRDLWPNHTRGPFFDLRSKAEHKFCLIREKLPLMLQEARRFTAGYGPIWCFPKGKKNRRETPLECALRETQEETGVPKHYLRVLEHEKPLEESYLSDNDKTYTNIYYIAECQHRSRSNQVRTLNRGISDEVKELRWVTLDAAKSLLQPRKFQLLQQTYDLLQNYIR
jgi:Asfivirus mRNA-decapping protein g5R